MILYVSVSVSLWMQWMISDVAEWYICSILLANDGENESASWEKKVLRSIFLSAYAIYNLLKRDKFTFSRYTFGCWIFNRILALNIWMSFLWLIIGGNRSVYYYIIFIHIILLFASFVNCIYTFSFINYSSIQAGEIFTYFEKWVSSVSSLILFRCSCFQ